MKKGLVLFAGLLLVAAVLLAGVGCAQSTKTGNAVNTIPSFVHYGSYMGTVFDAITGAALGGDDLKVYLIQGTEKREADKLVKDSEDDFVGDYAFNDVPFGINAGDLDFRIVVLNEGYQRFEAVVSIAAGVVVGNGNLTWVGDNDSVYTNEILNFIGDIYLYPLDSSPGDLTVTVLDPQGDPVPNATVLLQQDINNNNTTTIASNNALAPVSGLHPSMSATSDTSGVVTFSGDNLVLGGNYTATVEAITVEGQELYTLTPSVFTVGTNTLSRTVNMTAANGSAFALVSASNQVANTVTSSGVLTITFNQPIIIETGEFTAVETSATGVLDATTPVSAALSNGDKTLTITPNWTTAPAATDIGATISYTYNGKNIILKDTNVDTTHGPFWYANNQVLLVATN